MSHVIKGRRRSRKARRPNGNRASGGTIRDRSVAAIIHEGRMSPRAFWRHVAKLPGG